MNSNRVTLGAVLFFAILAAGIVSGCASSLKREMLSCEECAVNNLGPQVNSPYDDYAPAPIGNRLYFTSNRPTVEGYIQGDDIWFSDIEAGAYTPALNFGGTINSTNDEGAVHFTPDGGTVFFTRCWREDGKGDADIYTAAVEAPADWQKLKNLGDGVNTKYWDSHVSLSPDGNELYFASDRPGGHGGTDIWVSRRLRSGAWGPAKNLGPTINTSGDEKSPFMHISGDSLFFASNGHSGLGGFDIFVSVRDAKRGWKPPVNIGRPFNSAGDDLFFRVTGSEDTVLLASNRNGGYGGLDLYAVTKHMFKNPARHTWYLLITVRDTVNKRTVSSARLVIAPEGEVPDTLRSGGDGRVRIATNPNRRYRVSVSAPNYLETAQAVKVPQMDPGEYRVSVVLQPVKTDTPRVEGKKPAEVPTVYFEFDKADVRPEYARQLDRLFEDVLKKLIAGNVDFEVQLDAHTDDYGTEEYNIALSRRRGEAVSKYLSSKGVPRSVIVMNAYGETRPVAPNDTEEGRQLNRRVEVFVRSEPVK
ncbi:MAG: OmpA family protein [Bacteroidota bacterium]|nr:OmpA family protein [Bacteroidota bacterium]